MCYLRRTIATWVQSDKSIASFLYCIINKSIQAPGRPPLLTLHHPPTLEASTCPTRKPCSSKNSTQFDILPLDLLHSIGIWNAGIVYCNKLKPVLAQLTQHNQFLCASTSYKLKYPPFDYCIHYDIIQYVWADRHVLLHKSNLECKWLK